MALEADEKFMRLALRLAARGLGRTSPNPMVGAVVVRGAAIVGRGYHRRAGEPHAEVLALRQAGKQARGATLFVTLEPCDHFGRTPPCTRAILDAGIGRVVAGMKDPNPRVAGRGIRRLRRAGVQVEVGVLSRECRELNRAFSKFITRRQPFVTLKAAMTLDGKIATRTGESRWISSEASRSRVHHLRQSVDGIMVGIGTVLKDDPLLTVRLPELPHPRRPLRIIVDSRLRLPLNSRIAQTAGQIPTLVATTTAASLRKREALARMAVEVLVVRADDRGRVKLKPLMRELARRQIVSVLLEGGPTLNASALEEKVVDRLLLFYAPKIIGGRKAPGAVAGKDIDRLRQAMAFEIVSVQPIGPDLLVECIRA